MISIRSVGQENLLEVVKLVRIAPFNHSLTIEHDHDPTQTWILVRLHLDYPICLKSMFTGLPIMSVLHCPTAFSGYAFYDLALISTIDWPPN